jgi:hypothetical protein
VSSLTVRLRREEVQREQPNSEAKTGCSTSDTQSEARWEENDYKWCPNLGLPFRERLHIFQANGSQMAASLLALCNDRLLSPGRFMVLFSVRGWMSQPQGHSASGRMRSIQKSNVFIAGSTVRTEVERAKDQYVTRT